jgi:hypothetical protein
MNGDWYPWAVDASEVADFRTAWIRFRQLQQEVFPASELVFCVNRETVGAGVDWRQMFPGAEYVDVLGVDYYNQHPYSETADDFRRTATETDSYGAPKGILSHLEFAQTVGLPLAVPEWSGNGTFGDSPAFIRSMYEFFRDHAGRDAGEVVYDILFNVPGYDGAYQLYGETRMPRSAEAYRQTW